MTTKQNFKCKECKTVIQFTPHGNVTKCEHHPFTKLKKISTRYDFFYVVAEFVRAENPVTKSSLRDILHHRIERCDIS